jgi:Pyruvate/2-oxoacid:ferredoxin oxidoreductase delta subunit
MYKRYHLNTSPAKLPSTRIGKLKITRNDKCLNCGRCLTFCIYDVHKRDAADPRKMSDPASELCKRCFACIQNCPQEALKMGKNEVSEKMGDAYWTPQIIQTIWNEAEEGKIPVYGAGYGGPFKGTGFDAIWTDMSEIVRPTRDGIHGREYISTLVDLGRKPPWISDFENPKLPLSLEIQVPMLLDTNPLNLNSKDLVLSVIKAAHRVGSFAFLDIKNYRDELKPYLESVALRFAVDKIGQDHSVPWEKVRFIEILLPPEFSNSKLEQALAVLKERTQTVLVSLGITDPRSLDEIFPLFQQERADVLHFYADTRGKSLKGDFFISEAIRKMHVEFVRKCNRDEITIIGSGGLAAAEHVPKLIICGADAVVLDLSLLAAMGCRICEVCATEHCPAEVDKLTPETAEQRLVNMICAWRDQLLEVLSAMGLRDVRRLRGEVGRAIFYEEIEREAFAFIFERNGPAK